MTELVFYKCQH